MDMEVFVFMVKQSTDISEAYQTLDELEPILTVRSNLRMNFQSDGLFGLKNTVHGSCS